MTDATEKVAFASPAWVDIARTVLEELVAEHGETGQSFSVCEMLTDAPPGMAGADATTAAWHVRIVDKTVTVGGGEIVDADLNVRVDYGSVLPLARLVYSPEMLAQMERNPPQVEGGSSAINRRCRRTWWSCTTPWPWRRSRPKQPVRLYEVRWEGSAA